MINYKTTLGAVITVLSQVLPLAGVKITPEIQGALLTVGMAIIGVFAKDSNVTGGTKTNK